MSDVLLFAVFPYVAAALAVVGSIYRYFTDRFSYSSFSSQLLESRQLFWGSIPWHYGVSIILVAHTVAFLIPSVWADLTAEQTRLYLLEAVGLALGLLSAVGLLILWVRRVRSPKLIVVTSIMDWVLLAAFTVQVVLGVLTALNYRWGSVWYLQTAVPWLWSLVTLNPQIQGIAPLPILVKMHIVNAFILIALLPYTRLIHLFTVPVTYLWRPYQVVIWNRRSTNIKPKREVEDRG